MVVSCSQNSRDGAASMGPSQVETVPGPQPQRGPTPATGVSVPSELAREGQSRATGIHIMQWNAEGVRNKKTDLQQFLKMHNIDICCLQETHLNGNHRFTVRGYEAFRQDRTTGHKGGVITLVKNSLAAAEVYRSAHDDTEILGIKVLMGKTPLTIINLYSSPNKPLQLHEVPTSLDHWLVLGDFNSHSPSWGYSDLDGKGEDLEDWMLEKHLVLINKPDDPPTCYSRAWRTTSTPDLAIATDDIAGHCKRTVEPQLGGSDHKPITIELQNQARPHKTASQPRWNYKKAKWSDFSTALEKSCKGMVLHNKTLNEEVELFTKAVQKAAKENIPRGQRHDYKPGWNNHLQQLHDVLCRCRDIMEANPTDENVTAHNQALAKFTKEKLQQLRESWHEKTQSLNMEKDTYKLWQLTKTLNGDHREKKQTVLEVQGQLQTGKIAANTFAATYAKDSFVTMPAERTRAVRQETRELGHNSNSSCMTSPIRMDELISAIKALRCKKAPGPDGVSNDMIKHFGPNTKHTLLKIINRSWRTGAVPSAWKKAHVVPIHKKGKDKKDPESYRPISLLSCLGKLMERILNRRLIWHLESNNLLAPTQTGYRSNRNTEDQLMLLAQEIENAFQEKKKVVSVFFDMTKAFDRVWREGLLLKLLRCKVGGRMFTWIKSFLQERTARVILDGHASVSVKMRAGVPQGGVLSPTLFLVYINDITSCIPRHVANSLHADDLAIWSAAEHTTSAAYRIQEGVTRIKKWTEDWGLELNRVKSVATVFSLSTAKDKVHLKLGETTLPQTDAPTFLGVKLDSRLTWKSHIEETGARAIKRLAIMRKLSGTSWGSSSRILKTVYTATVRPVMEYASSAWSTAAKTNKARLDKVQNLGLRCILGAMKTTPIYEMEKTASIPPLETRREEKLLKQGERLRRLRDHPLHGKLQASTKNRLKRQSQNHLLKACQRENAEILATSPDSCVNVTHQEWSPETFGVEIRTTIPGVSGKQAQSETALKALALNEIHQRYPAKKWSHVFTDGSAAGATKNGGSGVYIQHPGRPPETISLPSGSLCSNYRAEMKALQAAADHLNLMDSPPAKVVLLTDSLSVLQALSESPAEKPLMDLRRALHMLSKKAALSLQWIPAHCGIRGNEAADRLAKKGGEQPQHMPDLTYQEAKTIIKSHWKSKFLRNTGNYEPTKDNLHRLGRAEQTTIFRLRTGHCGLRAHLRRIGVAASALCGCGGADETPEHVLQACPLLTQLRDQTWPEGSTLHTKLWGTVDDLRRTSQFTTAAGLRL